MKVCILLSGGIDSMACVHFYQSMGYEVESVFCDYGQPAAAIEQKVSEKIASIFNIPYQKILIEGPVIPERGEICGRNALLVLCAFCIKKYGTYKIAMGIHSGTGYADCSGQFVSDINRVIDLYANGTIILEAPFLEWEKKEIIAYCQKNYLPINETYSCETGKVPPCGCCRSCLDRKVFLNENY